MSCALLQEQPEGDTRSIGYWSLALTDVERNYTTTQNECLAVVWNIPTLWLYLYGSALSFRTDHEAARVPHGMWRHRAFHAPARISCATTHRSLHALPRFSCAILTRPDGVLIARTIVIAANRAASSKGRRTYS